MLEESLQDFPGALVLVTHDRFMLDRVSTELIALDGRGGAKWFAGFDQWQAAQEESERPVPASAKPAPKAAAKADGPKKLTYMEQRELEQMEGKIMAAEEELHARQKDLENPTVLADRDKLHECCTKVDAAQKNVADLYARWEELEARR